MSASEAAPVYRSERPRADCWPSGIASCFPRSMNTIDAIAAGSLIPLNTSRIANTCSPVECAVSEVPTPPRMVDQVTWSPGLWWLLYRYEYLFDGMLPQLENGGQLNTYEKPDSMSAGQELVSAHPHWEDSQLVNPPPALATMQTSEIDVPPAAVAPISQPVSVGAFVDLLA